MTTHIVVFDDDPAIARLVIRVVTMAGLAAGFDSAAAAATVGAATGGTPVHVHDAS
jgi:hypothetical protein